MELAMANGFSTVGFTELSEQEMMWVDGGDFDGFLDGLKSVCKTVVSTAVDVGVGVAVGAGIAAVGGPVGAAVGAGFVVDVVFNHFEVGDKVADFLID